MERSKGAVEDGFFRPVEHIRIVDDADGRLYVVMVVAGERTPHWSPRPKLAPGPVVDGDRANPQVHATALVTARPNVLVVAAIEDQQLGKHSGFPKACHLTKSTARPMNVPTAGHRYRWPTQPTANRRPRSGSKYPGCARVQSGRATHGSCPVAAYRRTRSSRGMLRNVNCAMRSSGAGIVGLAGRIVGERGAAH